MASCKNAARRRVYWAVNGYKKGTVINTFLYGFIRRPAVRDGEVIGTAPGSFFHQ